MGQIGEPRDRQALKISGEKNPHSLCCTPESAIILYVNYKFEINLKICGERTKCIINNNGAGPYRKRK